MALNDLQTDEELKKKSQDARAKLETEIAKLDGADLEEEAQKILREGYDVLMNEDREYADDLDGLSHVLDEDDAEEAEKEKKWAAEDEQQAAEE